MKKLFVLTLTVLFGFMLIGCTTTTATTTGLDYDMFYAITDYDQVFDRRQENYLVYLYQPDCTHCIQIKDTVLEFASTYTDHVIFFFDVSGADQDLKAEFLDTVGVASSEFGTPTLLVVVNNGFDKTARSHFYFVGITQIPPILRDLENGSYSYWD